MANEFKVKNGLIVHGVGTDPAVLVTGSAGQLFSISNNTTGNLLTVNKVNGSPVLEVSGSTVGLVKVTGRLQTTTSITGSTIQITSLPSVTDDTVVVQGSNNGLGQREIDSRVWGTSLLDATNGSNDRIATFTDTNSLNGESNLTFNGTKLTATGSVEISGSLRAHMQIAAGIDIYGGSSKTMSANVSHYIYTGSGTTTYNLPAISGNTGKQFWIKHRGTGSINLVANGSDKLFDLTLIPSMSIYVGEAYMLLNDGTYWEVF